MTRKKNRHFLLALVAFGLCLISSSCVYHMRRPFGMQPSATFLAKPYEVLGRSQGSASNYNFLSIFTITERAEINRAIVEAISKKKGDALINVVWYKETQIWLVGTIDRIIVEGTVIKYQERKGPK